ncbi:hypothetical protein [Nostoc sp. MS1]|uniref:hypothetical protein n=1 Tax=Nostoc sp. MS1 TaxID=2764711 RepID=UPI001CC6404A|nr:hypothetical protein [Nostoc sp. MS1]
MIRFTSADGKRNRNKTTPAKHQNPMMVFRKHNRWVSVHDYLYGFSTYQSKTDEQKGATRFGEVGSKTSDR